MPAKLSTSLNTAVSEDMKNRVQRIADKQSRRPADVVRAALTAYLNKEEKR